VSERAYRPSNGSEGEMFREVWCWRCKKEQAHLSDPETNGCDILTRTLFVSVADSRYPKEWVYDPEKMLREGALTIGGKDGGARCTAFEEEKS